IGFDLNGEAISATIGEINDLSALAAAINGRSSATGVTASFADPSDKSSLVLSTTDGRDIAISAFTHNNAAATIDFSEESLVGAGGAGGTAVKVGTIELTSTQGQIN